MTWHSLETDPPIGDECVVLFPQTSDCGILFSASNPEFARRNALKQGYTHWMEIPYPDNFAEAEAAIRALYAENPF